MRHVVPRGLGPLGSADHGDGGERDLLLVLHLGAIDIVAPVAQPQAEQDAGCLFGGQAAVREVEDEFLVAARLVLGSQRRARFLAIGEPGFIALVAEAGQRQPEDLAIAFDEAVEHLPRLALEPGGFHAFGERLFQPSGNLVLVGNLRNKARNLRAGLAELNVHGISGIVFGQGQYAVRTPIEDGDCD